VAGGSFPAGGVACGAVYPGDPGDGGGHGLLPGHGLEHERDHGHGSVVALAVADADDEFVEGADADALPEPGEDTPAFLPGEEELEELLERTADLDEQA